MQSVGLELNERLRAAVAQREAGNAATVMDEEWEQWLKEAVEAGGLPFLSSDLSPNANIPGTRPATDSAAMHPRLLNAARLGQWQQIPDFLHNIVRQNIETNNLRAELDQASNNIRSGLEQAQSSPSPRTRPSSSANPIGRLDSRTIARLDNHFTDQFSRRPIQSSAATRSRLSLTRSSEQASES